ncbi:hypothetical protein SB768_25865, partial [Burkholderia sp. SIMBA_043]
GKLAWLLVHGSILSRVGASTKLGAVHSFAYDVLQHGREAQGKQPAEVWFDDDGADKYEVMEHSARGRDGEVLVLVYLTDVEMMTSRSNRSRDAEGAWGARGGYSSGTR